MKKSPFWGFFCEDDSALQVRVTRTNGVNMVN